MSLHVFGSFVTPFGTAANNRAETEGNITTLQKLVWHGQSHSTVSAEAIRFALRRLLAMQEKNGTNRRWDEDERNNQWKDWEFKGWNSDKASTYIDDDLLGYMTAEAAKEEGESGSANVRRAVLEVTRAVSLTPWSGDVTFNAASPGATPSAQKKGTQPCSLRHRGPCHAVPVWHRFDSRAPARQEPRRRRPWTRSAGSALSPAIMAASSSTSRRTPLCSGLLMTPHRGCFIALRPTMTERQSMRRRC